MARVSAAERARNKGYEDESLAKNTRDLYHQGWRNWSRWIVARYAANPKDVLSQGEALEAHALPADADDVKTYLTERLGAVCINTVVNQDWQGIRHYHLEADRLGPLLADKGLTKARRGMARKHADYQESQKWPLTIELLDRIRDAIDEGARIEYKYYALCELLFAAALRINEAAALTVGDVELLPQNRGIVYLTRSKTDQTGKGVRVRIGARCVYALRPILDRPADAALFETRKRRVATNPNTLATWLKTAVAVVGENPANYAGHSGRIGCAVYMSENGVPMDRIMRHGRWKKAETVMRYLRNMDDDEEIFDLFE